MKKITSLLTLLALLFFSFAYSQIPVTDAAANANLVYLNTQIATLNSNLASLNSTESSAKLEHVNTQKNTADQLGLSKEQENLLKKVPSFLKQGMEIKNILKKENQVIQGISQLNSYMNSNGLSGEARTNLMNQAYGLLNTTGSLVDTAVGILSDNNYRMESGERRNYLKDIDSTLSTILGVLSTLKSAASSAVANTKNSDVYKSNASKVLQSIKN